jgi:hypothetical protein
VGLSTWPPAPIKLKLNEIKIYKSLLDHFLVTFSRVAQKLIQKKFTLMSMKRTQLIIAYTFTVNLTAYIQ